MQEGTREGVKGATAKPPLNLHNSPLTEKKSTCNTEKELLFLSY